MNDQRNAQPLYDWRTFIIKVIVLAIVVGCTLYIHETPSNPFESKETYTFKPEDPMVNVLELTERNWEETVSYRSQPILLFLYAPSVRCAWSSDFADTFAELAVRVKSDIFPEIQNVTVAKLDGSENRFLAFELGIRGFPSLMLLNSLNTEQRNKTHKASIAAITTSENSDIGSDNAGGSSEQIAASNNKDNTEDTATDSFDGIFIHQTILEEIDSFNGLNLNRINRNEFTEYKGRRVTDDIMIWLYKQILSQHRTRVRITCVEKWNSLFEAIDQEKSILLLIYDSNNFTLEQNSIWKSVKFIDTAKLDVNSVPLEDRQKMMEPYNIKVDVNEPRVFLFYPKDPMDSNEEGSLRHFSEIALEPKLDVTVLDLIQRRVASQRSQYSQHHDEL